VIYRRQFYHVPLSLLFCSLVCGLKQHSLATSSSSSRWPFAFLCQFLPFSFIVTSLRGSLITSAPTQPRCVTQLYVSDMLISWYTSQHILRQASSPEIWKVAPGRTSGIKSTLGCDRCVAGLTLALICVAAAGLLVVRGDQWLTKDLIKSKIRRVYRKCRFLTSDSCFFRLNSPGSA